MIELIRINNPLDRSDQERVMMAVAAGATLETIVLQVTANLPAVRNTSLAVSVDGAIYPREQWGQITLLPEQQVTIIPVLHGGGGGGKDILRAVAMIVVMVVATVAQQYWADSLLWSSFGATMGMSDAMLTGIATVGAMAVGVAGSMLVNALIPPTRAQVPALNGSSALEQSNAYSWNPQTTQQQGTVILVPYGLCKLTGNVIGVYRETVGDTQYLNLLISLGEGPLADIFDITISGQAAAGYAGLEIHTRLGQLNQEPISFFDDTFIEYPLSLVVEPGAPVVYTTAGNDFAGLDVEVAFPQGLYYFDDSGNIQNNSVQYYIEYSPTGLNQWQMLSRYATGVASLNYDRWTAGRWIQGTAGKVWEEISAGSSVSTDHQDGEIHYETYWAGDHAVNVANGTWRWFAGTVATATNISGVITATGAKQAALRYNWRMDYIESGRYDIRITRLTPLKNDSRYGEALYLSTVREIVYDDFEYPGEALIGIRGLATDQLSGSFSFECKTHGKLVRVYYDGAWHTEASESPAWVAHDILTMPLLDNDGIPVVYRGYDPADINLAHWRELADYNADQVPDGNGGTEARLSWNGQFDSAQTMWDAALSVLAAGRATPYWRGNTICLAIDKPADPAHTFSVGNVLKDSFKESWLKMESRAGRVEVDYLNIDNNLERDKMTVMNHAAPDHWGTAKLPLQGCIRQSEVIRRCRYHLNNTLYLTRSATLTCDVDSLPVTMGSVVNVQHDVLMVGEGGRISSADALSVTLDKRLTIDSQQSYAIDMVTPSGMISRTVVGHDEVPLPNGDTVTRLQLIAPLDPVPEPYTVYACGPPDKISKPWRVINLAPAGDLKQTFSLAEYNATVFNSDYELPVLPTPNYSTAELLPVVTGLDVVERLVKRQDGTIDDYLVVTFQPPVGGSFRAAEIWLSANAAPYIKAGESATGNELLIPCREAVSYSIAARTINFAGKIAALDAAPTKTIVTVGKDARPGNCSAAVAEITPQGVNLSWAGVADADLLNYEVRLGAVWVAADSIAVTPDTRAPLGYLPIGPNFLQVKAWDTTKHDSIVPAQAAVTILSPSQPAVSAQIIGGDCLLSWSDATGSYALKHYAVHFGADFYGGDEVTVVSALGIKIPADWFGSRTFWVAGVDAGNNVGVAGSCTVTINAAAAPVVSAALVGTACQLSWTIPASTIPIDSYEIRRGETWATAVSLGTVKGTSFSLPAAWSSATLWVAAIDTNTHTGTPGSVSVIVALAAVFNLSADVIDNNVLLRWSGTPGSLSIDHYEIRRGSSWAGAAIIGSAPGTFSLLFESTAGSYTYWIAAYDTAGNQGVPLSITTTVNQPPDYILNVSWDSLLSGTKTNMFADPVSGLMAMVRTDETWATHFTNNGKTTIQDFINAGYTQYLQPATAAASYVETFDYGTLLAGTKITVTLNHAAVVGAPVVQCTIQTSPDNSTWTSFANVWQAYGTAFRYVKITLNWTSAGQAIDLVNGLNVRLDSKIRNDSGSGTVAVAANGSAVLFNVAFVDVTSISVTASGTTAKYAIYDFADAPNPTGFTVYLYDSTGNRTTGGFSWSARGY